MKKNSSIPILRNTLNTAKYPEISGWRKNIQDHQQDLKITTKLPALLQDRSDYHKHLIYPHWKPTRSTSDPLKRSKTKSVLQTFPLKSKQRHLECEKLEKPQMTHGKNIFIGSLTCRQLPKSLSVHKFIVSTPQDCKTNYKKVRPVHRKVSFFEYLLGDNETEETLCAEQIEVKDETERNEEGLKCFTSRTASAVVFGSRKTLFDVYSSAFRLGAVRNWKDVNKLINETVDKGVLITKSDKSKLILSDEWSKLMNETVEKVEVKRKSEKLKENLSDVEKWSFESIYSSPSSISRKDFVDKSEVEPVNLKNDCKSVSKRAARLTRRSNFSASCLMEPRLNAQHEEFREKHEKIRKVQAKVIVENRNKYENSWRKVNRKDMGKVSMKKLAEIEIIEPDDGQLVNRSQSVKSFYRNRSPAGYHRRESKVKTGKDPVNNDSVIFQGDNSVVRHLVQEKNSKRSLVVSETTTKNPESSKKQQKMIKVQKKTPKLKQSLPISIKSQKKLDSSTKIPIFNSEPQDSKPVTEEKNDSKLVRKEEVAERILTEYKYVPKSLRSSSMSLEVIEETPETTSKNNEIENQSQNKLKELKKSSKKDLKSNEKITVKLTSKELPESTEVQGKLINKRISIGTYKPSLPLTDSIKSEKRVETNFEDPSDNPQLSKPPSRTLKISENSHKSSFSLKTEDFVSQSSWSRSTSSNKFSIPTVLPLHKKSKKSEFSEHKASETPEQSSFTTQKPRSKSSIQYELNQLQKLKSQIKSQEKTSPIPSKNSFLSNSRNSDREDISFDLSELTQSQNFSLNKFAFTPQVKCHFSHKFDLQACSNINAIEIDEHDIDDENFEEFIRRRRFRNRANTVTGLQKLNNKCLEILDLEEFLPVQNGDKIMNFAQKIRRKDIVVSSRGSVVEIGKKAEFTFSGLRCEGGFERRRLNDIKIDDKDIVRSGGSCLVKDEEHRIERLYCRKKDEFNLEGISGVNTKSAEKILRALEVSLKMLEKVKTQSNAILPL